MSMFCWKVLNDLFICIEIIRLFVIDWLCDNIDLGIYFLILFCWFCLIGVLFVNLFYGLFLILDLVKKVWGDNNSFFFVYFVVWWLMIFDECKVYLMGLFVNK